jgi:hypothetical protein
MEPPAGIEPATCRLIRRSPGVWLREGDRMRDNLPMISICGLFCFA